MNSGDYFNVLFFLIGKSTTRLSIVFHNMAHAETQQYSSLTLIARFLLVLLAVFLLICLSAYRFAETCRLDGAYFLCRYDNLKVRFNLNMIFCIIVERIGSKGFLTLDDMDMVQNRFSPLFPVCVFSVEHLAFHFCPVFCNCYLLFSCFQHGFVHYTFYVQLFFLTIVFKTLHAINIFYLSEFRDVTPSRIH